LNKKNLISILKCVYIVPIILVLLIINLFKPIKICKIQIDRIGNSIIQFFCAKYLSDSDKTIYLFVLDEENSSNNVWTSIIKQELRLMPKVFNDVYKWARHFSFIHGLSRTLNYEDIDKNFLLSSNLLSEEQNNQCKEKLKSFGWIEKDKIICLNIRDSNYLSEKYPSYDWRYHAYRDSDILQYTDAIQWLLDNGYYVVRTGNQTKKSTGVKNLKFYDCTFSGANDELLDLWFFLNCYATITVSSGPDVLAAFAGKPMLLINYLPLARSMWFANASLAPKKLRNSINKNYLNLQEYLEAEFTTTSEYENNNIEIIDLNSIEILAIIKEFIKELRSDELNGANSYKNSCLSLRDPRIHTLVTNHMNPGYFHPNLNVSRTWLALIGYNDIYEV
jgi:putative glycosyltransferase (TIGR04372 family)